MKNRNKLYLVLLICVCVALYFVRTKSRPSTIPPSDSKERQLIPPVGVKNEKTPSRSHAEAAARIEQEYRTPIDFYGRVVDDTGAAVPGARITASPAADPLAQKSNHQYATSGNDGGFSFEGLQGVALAVWVEKEGYYATDKSRGQFGYAGSASAAERARNPTPATPAVFILQKVGAVADLIHVPRRRHPVPKNGAPVEIDLSTNSIVAAGAGHLRIETLTEEVSDPNQQYNWKCTVSVPGGGLIEKSAALAFHAPESGYRSSYEYEMDKSSKSWANNVQRQFFVKLPDGRFAHLFIRMFTSGQHSCVIEADINSRQGDRNLETGKRPKS